MATEASVAQLIAQFTAVLKVQQETNAALMKQLAEGKGNEFLLDTLSKSIMEFSYDEEKGMTFDKWYTRYKDVIEKGGENLSDADKARLVAQKLSVVDYDRFVSFILPKKPQDLTFAETITTLRNMFGHASSVFFRRFQCLQTVKRSSEDYVTYASEVNKACENFDIRTISPDQFKCLIFIAGLNSHNDKDVRTRLLAKMEMDSESNPMTLNKLLVECQMIHNLKHDADAIENPSASVKAVHRKPPALNSRDKRVDIPQPPLLRRPCWQCGQMHTVKECPYNTHVCKSCGETGHKEGYCNCCTKSSKASVASPSEHGKPKKRFFRKKTNKYDASAKGVYAVNKKCVLNRRKFVEVEINGKQIVLQLDNGSDYTIISEDSLPALGNPKTQPTNLRVSTAAGNPLPLESEFIANLVFEGQNKQVLFYVTSVRQFNVLGSDVMEMFGLFDKPINAFCKQVQTSSNTEVWMAKFPEVFENKLGLCTKTKIHLTLKPGSMPVFRPKRPVPFHSRRLVEKELDRLIRMNVLEPVDFSDWAAPIVVVRKAQKDADGDPVVRICADYSTGLNAALEANNYPLPTPDEIFAKLAGSQRYTVIDLSDAYLQMEVDQDSQKLLTINTHKGLFRYNRLPPGVKAAPGAFQKVIDSMLGDLDGVEAFLDDVLIHGKTQAEHDSNVERTLQRIYEYGFRLKIEKCKFNMTEVKYLGHIVDKQGIRTDPVKVAAISNMPAPRNVSELRSFLGAINYYGRFVKEMHKLRRPLDELLKKDTKWCWSDDCESSFQQFKKLLSSELVLTHYNPNLPIIVAADASSTGIGATVRHRFPDGSEKIIQHASRSLTQAERNYGQIDKEALGLVYAVTKFHRMLLGRHFTLETDHKPLLRIFGSHQGISPTTSNRLQRLRLTLLCYDFDVQYVPTAKFGYADILSRLISSTTKPEEEYVIASIQLQEDMQAILENAVDNMPITAKKIAAATKTDSVLTKVTAFLQTEWPESGKHIENPDVKAFYNRRDDLTLQNECIMFGHRVVVPNCYRKCILKQLHLGHPGTVRMKTLARGFVYWPKIDEQIAELVRSCKECATVAKTDVKTLLESWPTPEKPWQRVHADFAGPINDNYFLLVVDALSKWPEIIPTKRITTTATISNLRKIFGRFGMPEVLVTDNGPQLTNSEFERFCDENGIRHIKTAPFHPQSNGQAERFVDTFKRTVKKIQAGGEDLDEALDIFLRCYRSTPCRSAPEGKSPAEIIFGRPMRTSLELLRPPAKFHKEHDNTQDRQYNRKHGSKRKSFDVKDEVYAKVHHGNTWTWTPGEIVERVGSVIYNVWLPGRGRLIRSHANQLRVRHSSSSSSTGEEQTHITNFPLDILLEDFGMRYAQAEPGNTTRSEEGSITEEMLPSETEQLPSSRVRASRIPVPPRTSHRREIRLPARFNHYVME